MLSDVDISKTWLLGCFCEWLQLGLSKNWVADAAGHGQSAPLVNQLSAISLESLRVVFEPRHNRRDCGCRSTYGLPAVDALNPWLRFRTTEPHGCLTAQGRFAWVAMCLETAPICSSSIFQPVVHHRRWRWALFPPICLFPVFF